MYAAGFGAVALAGFAMLLAGAGQSERGDMGSDWRVADAVFALGALAFIGGLLGLIWSVL